MPLETGPRASGSTLTDLSGSGTNLVGGRSGGGWEGAQNFLRP